MVAAVDVSKNIILNIMAAAVFDLNILFVSRIINFKHFLQSLFSSVKSVLAEMNNFKKYKNSFLKAYHIKINSKAVFN
jgi:hypothetical protein